MLIRKLKFLEAATGGVLKEKVFIETSQNSQENTCARVSFLINLQAKACNFIEKETLEQVHSCEFCEVSKKTFLAERFQATASKFHTTRFKATYHTSLETYHY